MMAGALRLLPVQYAAAVSQRTARRAVGSGRSETRKFANASMQMIRVQSPIVCAGSNGHEESTNFAGVSQSEKLSNPAELEDSMNELGRLEELVMNTRLDMRPREIVAELDRHIVGQVDAKRAVAVALRSRWRRHQLTPEQMKEIAPKNILMIGSTGVGKTEIARRIAKLSNAPFIKDEATKFTEVGFVGRDAEMIIKDLVDISIAQTRKNLQERLKSLIDERVSRRILDAVLTAIPDQDPRTRRDTLALLKQGVLDNVEVNVLLPPTPPATPKTPSRGDRNSQQRETAGDGEGAIVMITAISTKPTLKRLTVGQYRKRCEQDEFNKLVPNDLVIKRALESVEQDGVVFLDEIDKVCSSQASKASGSNTDASDEGVQRDLLPLIEGCTVSTKHGDVNTSKILFICAGSFSRCKPSDLLPELQGRLPIRVELKRLTADDFYRILTEPVHNQVEQHIAMLATEGIKLSFTEEALRTIASLTSEINDTIENIGARRLYTVLEKLIEDVSFNCDQRAGQPVQIGGDDVRRCLGHMLKKTDFGRFIL